MRSYLFIPPVKRGAGGVAVLLRMASALAAEGVDVALVERESGTVAREGLHSGVAVVAWDDLRLSPGDVWLVPEGWVNALAPGLSAKARCVVYCQNWAYLFSSLPEGVDWRSLDVEFWAVSDPVAFYIEQTLGKKAPVLRPGIDTSLFRAPEDKPEGEVRISWMPRKNKSQAEQTRAAFEAIRRGENRPPVAWREIHGLSQEQVAAQLAASHVFLATGFPEGCPLPPLEAMASGCLVVGFPGFGGFDYMRQATDFESAASPWFPLRKTPWAGNGLFVNDADVLGAAQALCLGVSWWESGAPELDATLAQARTTASEYGLEEQSRAVTALWRERFA